MKGEDSRACSSPAAKAFLCGLQRQKNVLPGYPATLCRSHGRQVFPSWDGRHAQTCQMRRNELNVEDAETRVEQGPYCSHKCNFRCVRGPMKHTFSGK